MGADRADTPARRQAARRRAVAVAAASARPGAQGSTDLPPLVVRVDLSDGRVTLTGRLAGGGAHVLQEAVSAMLRAGRTSWDVDVAGLDVADDDGLRVLVGAYRRAVRHGRRLTLHRASAQLQGALGRLRLERHLLPAGEEPPG
ncbi:STAS domain-containing protein [Blastococcus litoris]|uniref:STAS domain-containing protein n=1 Tax=Blastococcus litoris TaxID=2171622 RepID=UPI0013DEDF29|nr:STAS domain-containing protein [Blastococcus litoris]